MGKKEKIGELLLGMGVLREEQITSIVGFQKKDRDTGLYSRFGEVCVRKGWVSAPKVTIALKMQKEKEYEKTGLADVLFSLGTLTEKEMQTAVSLSRTKNEEIDEIILENEFCTPEELKAAGELLFLRRSASMRSLTTSSYAPFNIMPLLVLKQIDKAMDVEGQCLCSQCWNNIFSLSLNNLPPLYVSDNRNIDKYLDRFNTEYKDLIKEKLDFAVGKVSVNPKASCRSRFSDDLLTGTDDEALSFDVLVNVSNRHIHLSQEDLEALFGKGYELKKLKDLMQTGQYAAEETVTLSGPKGEIPRVRILGPVRAETQIEISGTDQFVLGVRVPVRASGRLEGTPGIRIIGPENEVTLEKGVIRALRHVHMHPSDADRIGVHSGEMVNVRLSGDRSTICEGVLLRATESSMLEMHIDTDEANAAGLASKSTGQILVSPVSA